MTKPTRKNGTFLRGMAIYAVIFLCIAGAALQLFWNYMAAFEASRPHIAIDAYMENLTDEHIVDLSQELIDAADHKIQSEEQCRAYLMDAIEGISCAKKQKDCTDTRQVFVVKTGSTVIGEFSIAAQKPDRYGFTPWVLERESFDLHVLDPLTEERTVTIPSDHHVTVNGVLLNDDYITDDKIHYKAIEEFYDDYDLPYRVTYRVPSVMGELNLVITDAVGSAVEFDENTDWTPYFHNCTAEETEALNEFTKTYVTRYVAFTGSRKDTRENNYWRLLKCVVRGSDFAQRLAAAVEGLEFGQSQRDKVVSLISNHQVRLEEGRFLCDITYEVDTTGRKGVVRTTTNAKLIVVLTDGVLKVESMQIY